MPRRSLAMAKRKKPKNQVCSNGNMMVYCHYDKELKPAKECYPCAECDPCASCPKSKCPFSKEV